MHVGNNEMFFAVSDAMYRVPTVMSDLDANLQKIALIAADYLQNQNKTFKFALN